MVIENSAYSSTAAGPRLAVHETEERILAEHRFGAASHVAWGAVIAGGLTALAILALFSALAYAVGIPAYRGGEFGWGAGIWCIFSAIVSFLIGGCLASYLTVRRAIVSAMLQGLLAWVLATILVLTLSGGAAGLFRGLIVANAFWLGILPVTGTATHAQIVGAGWAAFLSMFCGLMAACIGGIAGYYASARQPHVA